MIMNFINKKVLVTGSEGLIGKELVILLRELGAIVRKADLILGDDLTNYKDCEEVFEGGIDYVFHLAGIKGSPFRTNKFPVDFMAPMLQFDTNMIIASQRAGVKGFLYTSSIAVEHPEEDKYPAWAKKTAETLLEAYKIQYPLFNYCIVRPANVYGKFDNFETEYPMVITSMIKNALKEKYVNVWGNGENIRDFINAKDVAKGMIKAMMEMPKEPVNLCSGIGFPISHIAKIIAKELKKEVVFDYSKKGAGTPSRVMNLNWDFKPLISLEEGIKEVIECQK